MHEEEMCSRIESLDEVCLAVLFENVDARGLGLTAMTCRSLLEEVESQAGVIAISRGLRRSVVAETSGARLRKLLARREAAVVFESFENNKLNHKWEGPAIDKKETDGKDQAGKASLSGLVSAHMLEFLSRIDVIQSLREDTRFCTVSSTADKTSLQVCGGDEANFSGIRLRLDQACRPRKISFRYKLSKASIRRGFCNIFFSRHKEPYSPCRLFTAGSSDVFSFLLPLNQNTPPELWLPGARLNNEMASEESHHDAWHRIEAHFAWGDTELLYRIIIDNDLSSRVHSIHLPQDFDAIHHIYIFNWLMHQDDDNSLHHYRQHHTEEDDEPVCNIADLMIEENFPCNTLTECEVNTLESFCRTFRSQERLHFLMHGGRASDSGSEDSFSLNDDPSVDSIYLEDHDDNNPLDDDDDDDLNEDDDSYSVESTDSVFVP